MKRILRVGVVALLLTMGAGEARAQEEGTRYGIGVQSSWPAYGVSGLVDVSDQITVQAILGGLGTVTTVSGRLLYHFQKQPKHSLYGFGTLGLWRYGYGNGESESVLGAGGGAGVELNLRAIVDDSPEPTFPRLYWSFDVGFVAANFDHYNFSGLVWGAGLHYRF